MGEIVLTTLQQFSIGADRVGYFVLDNASNNNTTINLLARKFRFNKAHCHLRCSPHTLNLIGQVLTWGNKAGAFNSNNTTSDLVEETQLMKDWRRNGPLGVLLGVVSYIKTPQQYALFEKFQRLAHEELPVNAPEDTHKILEPIKPVVTRWNSLYNCFTRAVKLQSTINAYANHHIDRIHNETTYAISKGNQLPDCPPWMRSNGLTADNWQVVTEYMDVLSPLKECTLYLEGRGKVKDEGKNSSKRGSFDAIVEIIPVFEYLFGVLESRLQTYNDVVHDARNEALKDHLAINLRAAISKAREYYGKLDNTPAYYAATILHL